MPFLSLGLSGFGINLELEVLAVIAPPGDTFYLLQEDGFAILLESGDHILLEGAP